MASYQYIFTMKGLSKVHPPDKTVLKDIWLAFLPGAKIGVLGANGAGKSTLLRIMAGLDRDFGGEAFAAEGVSIGFLPQEPVLDPAKTVLGNIEEGVAAHAGPARRVRAGHRAARRRRCRPTRWTRCSSSRAGCRTGSTRRRRGTSTRASNSPWTRCGCRRPTPT